MKLAVLLMTTAALLAAQDPYALAYRAQQVIANVETDPQAFADLVEELKAAPAPVKKGSERVAAITDSTLTNVSVQSAGDAFRLTLNSRTLPTPIFMSVGTSGYLLSGDNLCYVIWSVDADRVRFWAPNQSLGGVVEFVNGASKPTSNGYCTVSQAIGAIQILSPTGPTVSLFVTWSYDNPAVDSKRTWLYAFNGQFAKGYALWELKQPLTLVAP